MDILKRVKEIIHKTFDSITENQITPEAEFILDLGLDSLEITELIMEFETEFDIDIPNSDIENIKNVNDAVKYIQNMLQ